MGIESNFIAKSTSTDNKTIELDGDGQLKQLQLNQSLAVTGLDVTNTTANLTIALTGLENRSFGMLWIRYFLDFYNDDNYNFRETYADLKIELDAVIIFNERIHYANNTGTSSTGSKFQEDKAVMFPLAFSESQQSSGADLKITITGVRNYTASQSVRLKIEEMKLLG